MASPTTRAWIVLPALLSLAYAIAVVIAAWRAPEKGFQAFTGHRVVYVAPGGRAEAAGLREGDVIRAIDGVPVASTFDYAYRVLVREPGERVVLGVDRAAGDSGSRLPPARETIAIELGPAPPPWSALVATLLAAVLLVLGLVARIGRPGELVARRFYRTAVMYAMVYVGALSWSRLLVHPVLALVFLVALFAAPKLAIDLSLELPHRIAAPWLRRATLAIAVGLGGACGIAVAVAIYDFQTGGGDRALPWIEGTIAAQCAVIPIYTGVALWYQLRAHREAHGTARAQLRWLLFGQALCGLPALAAIPVAALDLDRFLIAGYQPFAGAVGILWFVAYGLAVMRIRLADVDALIKSSLGYAVATGAAALVYVGVVLAAGWLTELAVGDAGPWAHLAAGIVAALAFGPLRARVTRWIDRRFFRDRRHYVEALRRASESLARLREPAVLARELVAQVVEAVRAEKGALYLHGAGGWTIAHAVGELPAEPIAPADGIAVPIVGDNTRDVAAMLVLGPRRSGDLYSSEDRDLLGALAGQLATVLANARAYGTIVQKTEEIRELRDRLADENQFLRERIAAATGGATLAGDSAAVRELGRMVELVAKSDASVLLLGESGTGKGLLARLVHATSPRAEQAFLHVDCGAIAAGVFESELFGHERGAFTGATKLRRGPIELADGGTLFLDEIGELPLELQPKLLRVLEERCVMRVGATQPVAVDVRIIVATNRDLESMTKRGAFREDLYFRLRVVELVVPPLRARRADLPALCAQLLPRAAKRCGRPVRSLAPDALDAMARYNWPGNVRELANVLERALVMGEGEITAAELELPAIEIAEPVAEPAEPAPHDVVMEDIERRRLTAALREADGNQSHAAKALGMPRTTFINKLRRHGLL